MNLYLPGAKWCPITYRAEAGKFSGGNPLGYLPHVQQGNGSLFGYFNRLTSPNRLFSTAWIAKDGHSEQYTELTGKPWAQAAGNATYWAFECEGYVGEPLTAAQINTLAVWHNYLGVPDVLANAPGQRGIGLHRMGGAAWGGHSCPGDIRAAQRPAIIARAKALRGAPLPGPASPIPPVVVKPVPKPAPTRPVPSGKIMLTVDGIFGPQSRMRLQQWAGVLMDSILGPISWRVVQRKVGSPADGIPGPNTWKAIQRMVSSPADGVPGPDTYRHLQQYLNSH